MPRGRFMASIGVTPTSFSIGQPLGERAGWRKPYEARGSRTVRWRNSPAPLTLELGPAVAALEQLNRYLENRAFKDFVMRRREAPAARYRNGDPARDDRRPIRVRGTGSRCLTATPVAFGRPR